MVKNVVEAFFAKATEFAAVSASGSASWWGYCQPEEPENIQVTETAGDEQ